MMINETLGMIDIGLCADVVAKNMADNVVPLAIGLAVMIIGFGVMAVLWGTAWRDKQLLTDYLRRRKALNDFEDWRRDRRIE